MDKPKFKFVDLAMAAELLNMQRTNVMELVAQGRIKPKTNDGTTVIFHTADVMKLAEELGLAGDDHPPAPSDELAEGADGEAASGKGKKRKLDQDPIRKVSNRLAAERKWLDVSEEDMREWVAVQEPISYAAIRKQINRVEDKLRYLLFLLNSGDNKLL